MVSEIIRWYQRNKRDLPWRSTCDPYLIWLSEIILQQTRVEQGLPYFNRFVDYYPSIADFAAASEDEILKLWQGLGYYSRGRNMHHTAQLIMKNYAGHFPTSYEVLLKLKGIGEYTAAAIASFANDEPRAAVDGNVFRVLSRYFGIDIPINTSQGKLSFTKLAGEIMDRSQPGIFNQAMMEFGALQCVPKKPDCVNCPINSNCQAAQLRLIDVLPVKIKAKKVRQRYFNFIVARKEGAILMNKRGPNDIWQNLYELPLFETEAPALAQEVVQMDMFKKAFGDEVIVCSVSSTVKHLLTHQKLFAQFIEIQHFSEDYRAQHDWFYVADEDVKALAKPKLIFNFFDKVEALSKN